MWGTSMPAPLCLCHPASPESAPPARDAAAPPQDCCNLAAADVELVAAATKDPAQHANRLTPNRTLECIVARTTWRRCVPNFGRRHDDRRRSHPFLRKRPGSRLSRCAQLPLPCRQPFTGKTLRNRPHAAPSACLH
ncbi:hypothetical protein C2845_PM13G10590 [Panicum miliaceum]|uniref:Uncharacterized protein n=1 Tax=Panicum miliaceum TaxID=4540 RepID=A0A3L6RFF0_PANMI|nr:hypothetical protein C2845_PM13G10590 [Panicum miliaceum]